MNVRQRLFVTTLGLLILGAGTLTSVVLWSFQRFFLHSAEADLAARTEAIAETAAELLERDDAERLRVVVERYGSQEGIALRVLAPGGRLLATSEPGAHEQTVDWREVPGVTEALAGRAASGSSRGVSGTDDRIFRTVPVVRDGALIGVVRMSRSLAQLQAHTRATAMTVLIALAAVVAVGALLLAWFARGVARPIQQMRDFAVALGHGDLGTRLQIVRTDELGELGAELNRMAERLAALEGERRAFLANASHELRTPVSNLHVTLQALEGGASEDPELRARFLRNAVDETRRLRLLIQDLLDLGHLEAGITRIERQDVPLRSLLERASSAIESRAREREVAIVVDVADDIVVHVDPDRILQALLCVLDNALKFSPAGGRVDVAARSLGDRAEVVVRDEGPGVADVDRPHVFEQFYTADRARKRGGTGLGLAIARRILDVHGGAISLGDPAGGGASFVLALPLAAPAPA
jgi:signal transduction histidine kinase